MSIKKPTPPAAKQQRGTSMPQSTATRSGSRPTGGRTTTPSSAPTQPHKLGRAPGGWLR